jgi:antagonist of KipI
MKIIDPGLMTTVQDRGRFGYQKRGVAPSGAMDPIALELANLLVGNEGTAAGLEMTIAGPTIEFQRDELISICGADLSPEIANLRLPTWRAIFVRAHSVLSFGAMRWGCRSYLSVAGGVAVPEIMGSRSTYTRAGIGGFRGRALRVGDEVPVGSRHLASGAGLDAGASLSPMPFALSDRMVEPNDALGLYRTSKPVRVVTGPHYDLFDKRDRQTFLKQAFEVSPRSDRMGYRLSGPLLGSGERAELVSSAVVMGTVQVPGGGEPIVLMADRQTTGGYPSIAHVAAVDLPTVAQLKPGDAIGFEAVTIERAQSALRGQRERLIAMEREVTRASRGP